MKIIIACSMSAAVLCVKTKLDLIARGNEVIVPKNIEKYANDELPLENKWESTEAKIKDDLIRNYFEKISHSDVLLVLNQDKNGIANYIGGNTFLEIGFAYVLKKPIYLYNPVPDMIYTSEIAAMEPIVINGDLSKIQ